MALFFNRVALVGIGAVAGAVLYMVMAQPQDPAYDQTRIQSAIVAFANQQQAERVAVSNALVASRANDLLHDPNTPVFGNPEGDVSLVEFFDYICPVCKVTDPRVKQLQKDDDGVRRVLKEFPILTPESLIASKAALAAKRQGMYESYHNALMESRGQLSEERIFAIAEEVGLDVARIREDMEAPEIIEQIIENFNLARALRVFSTPTYIVNDRMINLPSEEIDFPAMIEAARS